MDPPVKSSSFGVNEEGDLLAALDFLKSLKTDSQNTLAGDRIGVYGVELGAYAALLAASREPAVRVLALDSVPRDASELVNAAVRSDLGISNPFLLSMARAATRTYFLGQYHDKTSCELASALKTPQVLLLAGADNGHLRDSTVALGSCFSPAVKLEARTDLPLTGFTLASATGEQGEAYDRPVIDFFSRNLR